jgi:hypothetical protein
MPKSKDFLGELVVPGYPRHPIQNRLWIWMSWVRIPSLAPTSKNLDATDSDRIGVLGNGAAGATRRSVSTSSMPWSIMDGIRPTLGARASHCKSLRIAACELGRSSRILASADKIIDDDSSQACAVARQMIRDAVGSMCPLPA